jgi:hypothetical protein
MLEELWGRVPHTPAFLQKSAESAEKKRVEFHSSVKKCKRARKSAQKHQNERIKICFASVAN